MASKQQIIGIGAGAVFGLLALGGAYLLWDGWSARTDAEAELEAERETFASFNAAKVFPSKKSIASVQSNATSFTEWRAAAFALASRGDKTLPAESSAVFKQRLGAEVQALVQLPGGAAGKLAAETFLFGFEQYLGESGVLPPQQDVPRLAVQLDTIASVARLFSAAGVSEVKGVTRVEKPAAAEEDDGARKGRRKAGRAAKAEAADTTSSNAYRLSFTARPEALVKVLNAFAAATRFAVVTSLSFAAAPENMVDRTLDARQAAKEGAAAGAAGGRRGRRGRRTAVAEEEKPGERKDARLVVDPALDLPLAVELTLVVYDFGHPAAPAAAAPAKEAK